MSDRGYAKFHICMTALLVCLATPVVALRPTEWNITFVVVCLVGFWFWAPIPVMLRRKRREREREREA